MTSVVLPRQKTPAKRTGLGRGLVELLPSAEAETVPTHLQLSAGHRQSIVGVAVIESGSGVIVLTDMFGGTPSNLALSIMNQGKIEVVAGTNLPMLIKLASLRRSASLEEAIEAAQEAGRKYINVASKVLSGEQD